MRIQCNGCEVAEAKVLCCADEAALCWDCDQKVHAANKLASKHQRVLLSHSSSQMPKCDICQETVGYFFCLEDRALLCWKCDVGIHAANPYVSSHQRFLLTGVKVGLGSTESSVSSTMNKSDSIEKASETESSQSISRRDARMLSTCETTRILDEHIGGVGGAITASQVAFTGDKTLGITPEWHLDEYLALTEFTQNYGAMDNIPF